MKRPSLIHFGLAMAMMLALLPKSVAETSFPARESGRRAAAVRRIADASPLRPTASGSGSLRSEHAQAIEELGKYLSPACRKTLATLYVRYDNPRHRGLGGKSTIIISGNLPLGEFRAVLAHELLGHAMDLGCLTGTAGGGPSPFKDGKEQVYADDPSAAFYALSWSAETTRRTGSRNADFVSGYARTDSFEDMAETAVFYVFHRREFRRMAKNNPVLAAKLAWMETAAFPKRGDDALSAFSWDEEHIPWDTTKLPYAWIGASSVVLQKQR